MSAQTQALYHAYPYAAPLPTPSSGRTPSSYHQHHHQHQPLHALDNSTHDSALQLANYTNAYMNPTLPQPPIQQAFYTSPHHGIKRSAPDPDDEFDRSSTHISTQFKKLRLSNNHSHHNHQQTQQEPSHTSLRQHHANLSPAPAHPTNHEYNTSTVTYTQHQPAFHATPPTLPSNDFMTIDETPHKIYISDLDSEIASIEAAERPSNQLFLPDFEKQIGAIPDHVLRSSPPGGGRSGDGGPEANNKALVLYQEPSSISVPEEEDAVRKAVSDTRRGIRERLRRDQQRERETARVDSIGGQSPGSPFRTRPTLSFQHDESRPERHNGADGDEDAMEIE